MSIYNKLQQGQGVVEINGNAIKCDLSNNLGQSDINNFGFNFASLKFTGNRINIRYKQAKAVKKAVNRITCDIRSV